MSKKSNAPVQIVVAAFQDEAAAKAALKELKHAKKEHLISIENAAVIHKDKKGKLHIKEAHDMGGGKGATIGAVAFGALSLMFPIGMIPAAVIGGLSGGAYAKFRDTGIENSRLKQIGDALEPETSALIAVVHHEWVNTVQEALEEAAEDVMVAEISADIAQQLHEGGDVMYTAISDEEGMVAERIAVSDSEVEITEVIATEEGVAVIDVVAEVEAVEAESVTAEEEEEVAA